ncbi:MAG TPA: glycosyltransferase [Acidimicrobiales bacterium]
MSSAALLLLRAPSRPTISVDFSVVVPTRNEAANISVLVEQLNGALSGLNRTWELLFVDDSDDPTPDVIRDVQSTNAHVSLVHRTRKERRGGLGGAVVEGINRSHGEVVVVMDGDLQHPPLMVRELITAVFSGAYDISIASRYVTGASDAGLASRTRRVVSRATRALAHVLVPKTRGVRDPLSGFFAVSRDALVGVRLRPQGFKILMEVLARSDSLRAAEIPFQMDPRLDGKSKAGVREAVRFIRHTIRLLGARWSWRAIGRKFFLTPLALILAVQFALSYRLIFRNTAFVDEATYLSAGHYELHVLAHGGANMFFPTYFSGSPTIYPILGALVADAGGLHAARFLSLGFMLLATILCYDTARRLWGRVAGWLAAAVFVTTQGTQFLGSFATFDAMSLMLVAVAAWIVVRFSGSVKSSGLIFLVVPVLALANATKYASAIFDPVVFLFAFFVILNRHGLRQAFRTSVALFATFGVLVAAILAIAPGTYLTGITSTTTNRAASNSTAAQVLHESWTWVGAIACIAMFAALLAAWKAWRGRGGWATAGTLFTLAIAVLLAPANQARIRTATSLNKHVTFGAWFGSVAAGWLIYAAVKAPWRRVGRSAALVATSVLAVAVVSSLLVLGTHQAVQLDSEWPNSTSLIKALRPLVAHQKRPILMDQAPVATYYLEDELALPNWDSTWYFAYTVPGTNTPLVGPPAFRAAVLHGYFSVIALDYGEEIHIDRVVAAAIHANKHYAWVGDFSSYDVYGKDTYVVWRLRGPR